MEIGYVPEISWKEEKKNRIRYDMIWYSIDSASVYKYIDVIKLKLMLSFIHPMIVQVDWISVKGVQEMR